MPAIFSRSFFCPIFMNSVIVTGTLSFDCIMNYLGKFSDRINPAKIHQISLSFLVEKMQKLMGGTAGNIAYTLRLLGLKPVILAAAGNDFGPYHKLLNLRSINTRYIKRYKNITTGMYFVITDQTDNQIGAFYAGSNNFNKKLHLPKINNSFLMIAANDPAAMKKYVAEAMKYKYKYMYDPAFQVGGMPKTDLASGIKNAVITIGNDYEVDLMQKRLNMTHRELVKTAKILITTLGENGSVIETAVPKPQKILIKRAQPKNTTDPTGAGDAYRAGFLAGFLRGFPLRICGQMGSTAAVYTVEKYGTITHFFTKAEFVRRYKRNFGERLIL